VVRDAGVCGQAFHCGGEVGPADAGSFAPMSFSVRNEMIASRGPSVFGRACPCCCCWRLSICPRQRSPPEFCTFPQIV